MAANSRAEARPRFFGLDLGWLFEPFLFVVRGIGGTV
jgi:hypothetical protein